MIYCAYGIFKTLSTNDNPLRTITMNYNNQQVVEDLIPNQITDDRATGQLGLEQGAALQSTKEDDAGIKVLWKFMGWSFGYMKSKALHGWASQEGQNVARHLFALVALHEPDGYGVGFRLTCKSHSYWLVR